MQVCSEYLRIYQDAIKSFDSHFLQAKKDSLERYRRRWDSLCGNKWTSSSKLQLSEVPIVSDRIPNPFSSLGADASNWSWITAAISTGCKDVSKQLSFSFLVSHVLILL